MIDIAVKYDKITFLDFLQTKFLAVEYDKASFLAFLQNNFLPDDFAPSEERCPIPDNKKINAATKLGACGSLDLSVYEFKYERNSDPRVTLSREAFAIIMKNDLASNALAVFVNNDSPVVWRLSLITSDVLLQDNNKTKRRFSNPRRYSFILGRDAKVKTPQQYLIEKGRVKDTADLKNRFSVEVLNKEFYAHLVEWYDKCLDDIQLDLAQASRILGKKIDDELKPQAVIRVIIRLLFMWFMKEKGLIDKSFFTQEFKTAYLKNENTYYNAVLQNLFFAVLNKKIGERRFRKQDSSNRYDPEKNDYGICDVFRFKDFFRDGKADTFLELTKKIPFVNGGLFTCHDYKFSGLDTATNKPNVKQNYIIDGFSDNPKDRAKISDGVIFALIELFDTYAFTIEENTPSDVVVALDPELLGTVFENLIGTYNPETKESARKATGSFYTPREIVDYMCKESLKEALASKLPDLREQIADLIESSEDRLDFPQKNTVVAAITGLKILDSACGSGAFPIGMFTLMVKTVEKLQERKTTYKNKLDIITNCIYGVDIQNIAIEISKLRFFISLLVDYDVPAKIEDFEVLPNLETKFAAANTLIGINLKGSDTDKNLLFTDELLTKCKELTNIFTPFTTAKTPKEKETIKNAFEAKKQELVKLLVDNNMAGSEVEKVSAWNPFNVCYTSPFFDSGIMFGVAEGFDVVVGNPPYVDSETMTNIGLEWEREYIVKNFNYISGNWDIYMAFFEKGLNLSRNVLCYITPDKWLSRPFGAKFRKFCMMPKMAKILHVGSNVFENVRVDGIVSLFISNSENLITLKFDKNKNIKDVCNVPKNEIEPPYFIDYLFSENSHILDEIDAHCCKTIIDYSECEGACATSDAYDLLPLVENLYPIDNEHLVLINTGTIEKYAHRWGRKNITYLGKKLLHPVVRRQEFIETFGKSYIRRAISPKLIFKGLNLLDACIDFYGNVIPGKSTLVICSKDKLLLKFLCAIINSKLSIYYIKTKYASSSYCGGITFTKDMINKFPIPNVTLSEQQPIIELVDQILEAKGRGEDTAELERQIDEMVYLLYGLTAEEVQVVEGKE